MPHGGHDRIYEGGDLEKFLLTVNNHRTLSIIKDIIRFSRRLGSNSFSYHFYSGNGAALSRRGYNYFTSRHGLSRRQQDPEILRAVDLINSFILHIGEPFRLRDPVLKPFLPDDQSLKEAMRIFEETGVKDYIAFPAYGPLSADAVLSFAFPFSVNEIVPGDLLILEAAAKVTHSRLVSSMSSDKKHRALSSRELEVLRWICAGKSQLEIATILDITASTVDTHTRRIFKKLEVHDRVSAAVKAISEDLVRL